MATKNHSGRNSFESTKGNYTKTKEKIFVEPATYCRMRSADTPSCTQRVLNDELSSHNPHDYKLRGIFQKDITPTPLQQNLVNSIEMDVIISQINSIIEKQVQNHVLPLQSQLEEEKRNSLEFKKMLEKNLRMFNRVKESLSGEKSVLESELRQMAQKIVQVENYLTVDRLALRLATDLKNPLLVIKGTMQLIRLTRDDLDEKTLRRIVYVEKSISQMTHQIDDVLYLVKNKFVVKKPSALYEIIISALQTLVIPDNIKVNLPPDIVILCDPKKMEIVFSNMILNAVEAIGKQKGIITINTTCSPDSFLITIQDSGPGIPPQIKDRIFEPFVTSKIRGVGLGLATCKDIVQRHGGTIQLTNNPTTFCITLPRYT